MKYSDIKERYEKFKLLISFILQILMNIISFLNENKIEYAIIDGLAYNRL